MSSILITPTIVFFNHYHRGDLHTHKEFVKQLMSSLPYFKFKYLHQNPKKLTDELRVEYAGVPSNLSSKEPFYRTEEILYINTWVGCLWDVFCKNGGINMHTLYEQWDHIFNVVNSIYNTDLELHDEMEEYLPRIDFSMLDTKAIDEYANSNNNRKILICNNVPNSNQSFAGNMVDYIAPLAKDNPEVHFICTNKLNVDIENILYTSDIIGNNEGCDLQEISYLSQFCDSIVGKNSGPYVFCETYESYMNPNKTFISFNTKHPEYTEVKETMSYGLDLKCKYQAIPIMNIVQPTQTDKNNIENALRSLV